MDPVNIALSGMNSAAKSMAVSANNIANSQTTQSANGEKPFVPQQVQQTSQQLGGVATSLRDVSPPSVPVFSPDHPAANEEGIIELPNVDMNMEVANQLVASNTYKANANVIKRADQMYQSLLDITS